jgi:hypothetical protein
MGENPKRISSVTISESIEKAIGDAVAPQGQQDPACGNPELLYFGRVLFLHHDLKGGSLE